MKWCCSRSSLHVLSCASEYAKLRGIAQRFLWSVMQVQKKFDYEIVGSISFFGFWRVLLSIFIPSMIHVLGSFHCDILSMGFEFLRKLFSFHCQVVFSCCDYQDTCWKVVRISK